MYLSEWQETRIEPVGDEKDIPWGISSWRAFNRMVLIVTQTDGEALLPCPKPNNGASGVLPMQRSDTPKEVSKYTLAFVVRLRESQ